MEIFASTLVYMGLLAMLAGLLSLVRPLRFLRVRSRRTAGAVLGCGAMLVLAAMALPPRAHLATSSATRLDALFPAWQFAEVDSVLVHAPPARVYDAIHQVTADEIRFFRTLTWIRNPRRSFASQPASILAPPARRPILDVALHGGFYALADVPGRELVVGAVVCCRYARPGSAGAFMALTQPGFAKAGMNFLLQDEGDGWTRLSTETRVHGTDAAARRRFAAYWRVIYPGSALIRRGWLQAIKARAEGGRT